MSDCDVLSLKIMHELANNGVEIYCFPVEDEAVAEVNAKMNVSVHVLTSVCVCMCWVCYVCMHVLCAHVHAPMRDEV